MVVYAIFVSAVFVCGPLAVWLLRRHKKTMVVLGVFSAISLVSTTIEAVRKAQPFGEAAFKIYSGWAFTMCVVGLIAGLVLGVVKLVKKGKGQSAS